MRNKLFHTIFPHDENVGAGFMPARLDRLRPIFLADALRLSKEF
jgi:hypothetical protein